MTTTDQRLDGRAATDRVTAVDLGDAGVLEVERDAESGVLVALRGGGRDYLTVGHDGTRAWHGVCTTSERLGEGTLERRVRPTTGEAWTERYRWSGDDLVHVDGVEVRRDASGRVVACLPGGPDPAPAEHRWFYTHDERGLVEVRGPGRERRVVLGPDGRAREVHDDSGAVVLPHDADGRRLTAVRTAGDTIDDEGRTWVTRTPDGRVSRVFLWDGMRCLARVDGPLGSPLAAVLSLDPSGTPVRVVTPGGVRRVPRDAYGEGLLDVPDVPGLFGGRVHAGVVHLPLRRLDPRTGTFCEPDPWHGGDDDPRRPAGYTGPVPVEKEPRSAYEVCRGDPVGRSDPTGGVSAGLVLSTLTWSFQNNVMTFFGIDWWFNLFLSLLAAPFAGDKYDFFSSTGLSSTDRLGSFGVRRDGFMNVITGGRAFTTQHIVWSPDGEFADLQRGEVVDPRGAYEPTHYGTVLSLAPTGAAVSFLACGPTTRMPGLPGNLTTWSRHGGLGVPAAPGTLTPWFPSGGLHLDTSREDTRHDVEATLTELQPGPVGVGDFEQRSVLTSTAATGLAAGARVLVDDGTALAIATVVGVVAVPGGERVQLAEELTVTGTTLRVTPLEDAPASSETRPAGAPAASLDARGTTTTYAPADLVRVTATSGQVLVARVAHLEARLPLERPLPASLAGPIAVATGTAGPTVPVTATGTTLDFGTATPPGQGTTGLLVGGTTTGVRVETPPTGSTTTVDLAAPAGTTGFQTVTASTVLGSRTDAAEADPALTYTPLTAGSAPDGSAGLVLVRVESAGTAHARVVPGAPAHDVVVLDRPLVGTGPFTVERWRTRGAALTSLTLAQVLSVVVPSPERFEGMPLLLTRVAGEPPTVTAALTGVDVTDGTTTLATPTAAAGLRAGFPVRVGTEHTAVRDLRCDVTFAPPVDLGGGDLRLVRLEPTGFAYDAVVAAADAIDVRPTVTVGGTPVAAPFLRVRPGDLVEVTSGGTTTWHRVTAASAGRLTVTAAATALTPGATATVRQAAVDDPDTGCPFLGIRGARTGTGPTTTATFSLWRSDDLPAGTAALGIVDGDVTHPVQQSAAAVVRSVTFSTSFAASAVDVSVFTHVTTAVLASVTRDGGVLLAETPPGAGTITTAPGQSIVAVALEAVGDARTVTLGPGTLLVPDEETTEIDRGQSLTNHELTHTVQYARWGPLWFCAFPMIALELPAILTSDTELPEFSAFLDATVAAGADALWDVTIPQRAGVSIAKDDTLQVVQGSRIVEVEVRSVAGDVARVRVASGTLPTGRVAVRKKQRSAGWDVSIAILDLMTHGGLVNLLAGSTWGGIFWLVGKAFYGLGRAIGGTGDLYAGTVTVGGTTITLAQAADAEKIPVTGRVTIRRGEDTVIRSATRAGQTLSLGEAITFTGDVRVAAYDSHEPGSAFDWYDYRAGTVDAANHFAVDLGADHGLDPEDRVVVRYRSGRPFRTDVLAVAGARVELSERVPVTGGELSVRIARVGASDPLGNADSAAMVEMGMGWMKWLFDPFGQIEPAVAPGDWTRWLLRVVRWLLGTQNFSLLPFGYVWWGRLFGIQKEHEAPIEQEASSESGDVYSPLGRLTGEVVHSDGAIADARATVGDVMRYRYTPGSRFRSFVVAGRLDGPGVHLSRTLRVMPTRSSTGAAADPNGTVRSDAGTADPGRFVDPTLTDHDGDTDPRMLPRNGGGAGDALGFRASALGSVPVSARVQRNESIYAAFTRPGDHRVTTLNGIAGATEAVEAHAKGLQTLWFDLTVADVTVTAAGRTLDASSPGTSDRLVLVPSQSVDVTTTPATPRVYRVTALDPTSSVTVSDARLTAVAATTAPVPVEVSRYYAATDGRYTGGLAYAGMHLSRDLDVPVRTFTVEVVTTLPLRAAARADATEVTTLARGTEAFLLVPANVTVPPAVTSIGGALPSAGTPDPATRVDAPDAAAFLGATGSAWRVLFPASATPGDYELTVTVGDGATPHPLTCRVTVT
ncbi:eCIS core domain-containing protein [Cellulomonas palmilytica]|uniref:eCIS core domain-containing protein n=1 Tax=Cellulomonas palmilytica TaxID=2608402 RepID=UPI001F406861|nr:DUF4157 domain-containing protein [Cellulomonas palmilytica]UJP39274.1 DUF4157 domain-containing protein [Cellulomonas palmilytica]